MSDVKLVTAEGYGLHIRSAEELLAIIQDLIARIETLEGR